MSVVDYIRSKFYKTILGRWASVPSPRYHPQVSVGRHTYGLGPFTIDIHLARDQVCIGSFCSLAKGVRIIASGEHYLGRVSTFPFTGNILGGGVERDTRHRGSVVIGHDTWIGTGAIILSGTKIGNGAVIAAGAVVTGDVDDYAIVGGIPAKFIRYRFNEEQRAQLLEVAWWEWSDQLLLSRLECFYGNVDDFIAKYSQEDIG